MTISAIVTVPPYSPFIEEVARHPIVSGLRLNTVMPTKGSLEDVIKHLQDVAGSKDIWIDLKCRQLRVADYGVPPFTEITLTHHITVDTPVKAYFSDGKEIATVLAIDGKRLIMQEGPKRVIGPGESVNILHPSLQIEGYFTDTDKQYIDACVNCGHHQYMLSFVEQQQDIDQLRTYDLDAEIVAKIESKKGLVYTKHKNNDVRLMAARGDLFIEAGMPHKIIRAMEDIYYADASAIAASRLFSSLSRSLEPSCADIGDVDNLLRMGYKTVMFGDEICMQRDSIISGLNLFQAIAEPYQGGRRW